MAMFPCLFPCVTLKLDIHILRKPVGQIISVNSIMTKRARTGARLTAICRLRSTINNCPENYGLLSSINSNSTRMTR